MVGLHEGLELPTHCQIGRIGAVLDRVLPSQVLQQSAGNTLHGSCITVQFEAFRRLCRGHRRRLHSIISNATSFALSTIATRLHGIIILTAIGENQGTWVAAFSLERDSPGGRWFRRGSLTIAFALALAIAFGTILHTLAAFVAAPSDVLAGHVGKDALAATMALSAVPV